MMTNTQTNSMSSNKSDCKFYLMPGKAIIVVYLPMDKPAQVNHIRWLGMAQTKYLKNNLGYRTYLMLINF